MVRETFTLMQVLDLAIGTPDVGCLNLNLLFVCLKRLITHTKIDHELVDAEELGLPQFIDARGRSKIDARSSSKDAKNRANNLWSFMKLKNSVETTQEGIDRLYQLISEVMNGETNVVTWGALDEHLHLGEEKTHDELERTLKDLEKAKTFFADDNEKEAEIEKRREEILERKSRFMEQPNRRTIREAQKSMCSFRSHLSGSVKSMSDFDDSGPPSPFGPTAPSPQEGTTGQKTAARGEKKKKPKEEKAATNGVDGTKSLPTTEVAGDAASESTEDEKRAAPSTPSAGQRRRLRLKKKPRTDTENADGVAALATGDEHQPPLDDQRGPSQLKNPLQNDTADDADNAASTAAGEEYRPAATTPPADKRRRSRNRRRSDFTASSGRRVDFGALFDGGSRDNSRAGFSIQLQEEGSRGPSQLRPSRAVSYASTSSPRQSTFLSVLGSDGASGSDAGSSVLRPGDVGASAVKKTLSTVGAMALFRGATEARLNVLESQVKTVMKFRNAMMQGDLLSQLLKTLGDAGGMEALRRLIENEKKPGEGFAGVKNDLHDLRRLLEELTLRVDDLEEAVDLIKHQQKSIRDMMWQHHAEAVAHLEETKIRLMEFRDRCQKLEYIKADRLWVLSELGAKMDVNAGANFVTKEELKMNLEEIADSLNEFIDKSEAMDSLLRCHVRETKENLDEKLDGHVFYPFQQSCLDTIERIEYNLREILEISDGEQDGAFVKILKYHCASCDRPTRAVRRGKTPSLPMMDGLPNACKSAQPFLVYGQSDVRKHVRSNHNNTTGINADGDKSGKGGSDGSKVKTSTAAPAVTMKEVTTPQRLRNIRGYETALEQRRKREEDMTKRKINVLAAGGGRIGGADLKTDARRKDERVDERVDRKQMRENAVDAYYRKLAAGEVEDVWRQKRPSGGEGTVIKPRQRIVRDKLPSVASALKNDNTINEGTIDAGNYGGSGGASGGIDIGGGEGASGGSKVALNVADEERVDLIASFNTLSTTFSSFL